MNQYESDRKISLQTIGWEFKDIEKDKGDGFIVKLLDEDNLFEWEVALFGPPETIYQGGYFKCSLKFPADYPFSPPALRFKCKMWHPNINQNGDVYISILQSPYDGTVLSEKAGERWNPIQTVRTVLMNVISMLNEPNTFTPANVDAAAMYRRWKESNGKDKEYENIIREQVIYSKIEADKDDVRVPTTKEEYFLKPEMEEYYPIYIYESSDDEYDDDGNSDDHDDYDGQ